MRLFDLHCDTLGEIYRQKARLDKNGMHVSLEKALGVFDEYIQVMAVWSEHKVDPDENYVRALDAIDYLDGSYEKTDAFTPILAIEGGKLLNYELSRLDALRDRGVKIFTLVWKDECCMGGAYNNSAGLSDFGREALTRCFDLGIVPDLSHSNDIICSEVLFYALMRGKPVIASHSCSRAVFDHRRNLSDEIAKQIAECGGVVGVNFVGDHLGGRNIDTVLAHIDRFRSKCGRSSVCLGGDFDGTSDDQLPDGVKNVSHLPMLYDAIAKKYHSEAFADEIFYKNAKKFAKNWLF